MKFSKQASEEEIGNVFNRLGIKFIKYFVSTRLYHVQLSGKQDTLKEIETLRAQDKVLLASPNGKITIDALPNDPYFSQEWGLRNTSGSTLADLGMDEVWDNFTDASSTIVAVIDTGIDYTHPDLAANMWVNPGEIPGNGIDDDGNGYIDDVYGYDFANHDGDPMDDHFHGTHVAGTIGAVGNNGIGVSGVAWKAKLMALKFMDSSGSGSYSAAVEAIEYAIHNGAKVLNNSWGSTFNDPTLEAILNASNSAGVIFVAAAGNDGTDNDITPHYPSSYSAPNVISVASMNEQDQLSSFSNFGLVSVDIAAPGENILSTIPTWYYPGSEDYGFLSGTSMATPHVSGAAALLWSAFPTKTYLQIIDLLYQGGTPKSYLNGKTLTGKMVNVMNSLFIGNNQYDHAPLANAGSTQHKTVGDLVTLQAQVSDEDAETQLTYGWTFTKPNGSSAQLSSLTSLQPSFTPDVDGTYQATLIASDGVLESTPSVVQILVSPIDNTPPTVSIHLSQQNGTQQSSLNDSSQVELGATVTLDASSSTDNQAHTLDYEWTISAKPQASAATIQNANQAIATLLPDKTGTYHMMLTLGDGRNESTGTVTVVVIQTPVSGQQQGGQQGDGSQQGGAQQSGQQQGGGGQDQGSGQQQDPQSGGQNQTGTDTPAAAAAPGSSGGCSLSRENSVSVLPYNLFVLLGFYLLKRKSSESRKCYHGGS
ncbi:MAG: S8 family serine peptidase [Deltaproteobacteria bacterium]|nr:S8 family serine peptidase [Deltaproteobacteria bacterium]